MIVDLKHLPRGPVDRRIGQADVFLARVLCDAFAYVMKPFSPPDLLDTVKRAHAQAICFYFTEGRRQPHHRAGNAAVIGRLGIVRPLLLVLSRAQRQE